MKSEQDFLLQSLKKLGIPSTHSNVGIANLICSNNQYKSLFSNRRLPDHGWSDIQIQHFILTLSTLDTNTKLVTCTQKNSGNSGANRWCGVGEREGRIYSSLVSQRHFGLAHGIGRSGDITEAQPKAAGSSVMARLTLALVLDVIRRGSGLDARDSAKDGILLPMCTGMTVSLVLSTLLKMKKEEDDDDVGEMTGNAENSNESNISNNSMLKKDGPDYCVLWCRIDQKSCLKAIITAGLRVVVIPTIIQNDHVVTDVSALQYAIENETSRKNIVAVISTTSCFAPRIPDPVDDIAKLCQTHSIPHIINNAYGLQCAHTSKLINRACTLGRVDAIVFSMDKNFLVPVGGAVVVSPNKPLPRPLIQEIGKIYAGRASSSPILDLFITLLSMGLQGYKHLLQSRTKLKDEFHDELQKVAMKYGSRVLKCPKNTISFAITLDSLLPMEDIATEVTTDVIKNNEDQKWQLRAKKISYLGSMLFTRCVSGTRVVPCHQLKSICGMDFTGFGSSTDNYPHAYLTAACAIGLSKNEMEDFMARLDKSMRDFVSKQKKKK